VASAEGFRQLVVARAGGACEYCRLLEAPTGVTFHVEHIVPRSQGGATALENLALSCPGCNMAKSDRTLGRDRSGHDQPLFNPRQYEPSLLGWHLHFALDGPSGIILPRTPVAEATASVLDVNSANRVLARMLQVQAGLIA